MFAVVLLSFISPLKFHGTGCVCYVVARDLREGLSCCDQGIMKRESGLCADGRDLSLPPLQGVWEVSYHAV
jgi:hypothetical protein